MKAISIKGQWAVFIWSGDKTIETRTWKTNYRGKLLLCASKYPASPLSGNAFAIAKIIDCRPMVKEDEERARCELYDRAYSWFLADVKRISPFPVKGRLSLFEVDFDDSIDTML
jgi:hypothetical protein